ncbi:MAG: hypothetical protein MO846_07250 [Candidatus Devosia symbiotica]|nr:hypothetical protein [Candidatus Devosia symbiotica]
MQADQILDGRAPNSGTQVQISGQLLNLVPLQAAKTDDTLRFEVQSSSAQLKLALQVTSSKPQDMLLANTSPGQATTSTPARTAMALSPAAIALQLRLQ